MSGEESNTEVDGATAHPSNDTFKDLEVSPEQAKNLDGLESKYGIRPDFDHRGKPGFYAKDEKEWNGNMKATRQRMRFSSGGKINKFLQKHPGQDFMVRNPNKKKDFMYPVNRRKR